MTNRINTVTGNPEVQFNAKLISIGQNTLTLNNEKQTPYRVATIEFANQDGVVKQVSALVYEKNFSYGMSVGQSYLATAIKTPGQSSPLITLSHLTAAERASIDDFAFDTIQQESLAGTGEHVESTF